MTGFASLPNLLSLLRLALAPFVFREILSGRHELALWLFIAAAVTDALDGAFARHFRQTTKFGAYLDPIADKVLLSGVFLSLAAVHSVPWWLVIVIFGRDVLLLASSAVALQFTKVRQFRPSVWGKLSTFLQISCATAWMVQNVLNAAAIQAVANALIWPAAAATIWSALHYSWRGFRNLRAH